MWHDSILVSKVKSLQGSQGGSLAETTNGLFKTECIYGPDAPRRWADVGEVELATLTWVHWFNEHRLHSHCGDIPPAEFEAAFYAAPQAAPAGVGNQ
jgi:putative transposase